MNNSHPFSPFSWKILILGQVTGVLAWLPFEDRSILIPVLLALPVAGLVGRLCYQSFHWSMLRCGLVAGLVVAPATLLWMAFKTGVHGHGIPDFTALQIMAVIKSTPAWVLAGGLLGWGWQKLHPNSARGVPRSGE